MSATLHRDLAAAQRHNPKDHNHTATEDGGTLSGPVVNDYIVLTEGSAPSTPAAGKVRLYASSTGKRVNYKTSAGVVASIVPSSEDFPASPADLQPHFREDLGSGWVFDNALGVWLGPKYELTIQGGYVIMPGDGVAGAVLLPPATAILVTSWDLLTNDTNADLVDYWTFTLVRVLADASALTLATLDTSLDPAGSAPYFMHSTTTFTNNPTTIGDILLSVNVAKTGGPDPVQPLMRIVARDALAP